MLVAGQCYNRARRRPQMATQFRYAAARATFKQFREGLAENEAVLQELLGAFRLLLTERSTTYHENRFIVGGAVEHIVASAMRCVGLEDVAVVGFEEDRLDIRVAEQPFSLKSVFTPGSPIALINTQGEGAAEWTVPTIVVLACNPHRRRSRSYDHGIGYADPGLLPNATVRTRDQLKLKRTPLYNLFRQQHDYLLSCDIPANPGAAGAEAPQPIALSKSVARDILFRTTEGQSLFSEEPLQEFLERTAGNARMFPRLSVHMEADNGGE